MRSKLIIVVALVALVALPAWAQQRKSEAQRKAAADPAFQPCLSMDFLVTRLSEANLSEALQVEFNLTTCSKVAEEHGQYPLALAASRYAYYVAVFRHDATLKRLVALRAENDALRKTLDRQAKLETCVNGAVRGFIAGAGFAMEQGVTPPTDRGMLETLERLRLAMQDRIEGCKWLYGGK